MLSPILEKLLPLLIIAILGCEGPSTPVTSHGGPLMDHVSLVDHLRAAGNTVEPKGDISQPFFPVPGHVLSVNGTDIQVFEYREPGLVEEDAEKISPDGSTVGESKIGWMAPPHFFKKGKIIILYLGSDQKFLKILESTVGAQFAGG